MSLENIYYVSQSIAVIVILGTLVALLFQLRQTRQQLQVSNRQARADFTHRFAARATDIQLKWFGPGGRNHTMINGLLSDQKLTEADEFEFGVQIGILFDALSEAYTLDQQGLLDLKLLKTSEQVVDFYLQSPRVREWWTKWGDNLFSDDTSFRSHILTSIAKHTSPPETGSSQ